MTKGKKHYWLTREGKVLETTNLIEVMGISKSGAGHWHDLNRFKGQTSCTKADYEFLKRFGLQPTLFNLSCLERYNGVYLYPFHAERIKKLLTQEQQKGGLKDG